MFLRQVLVFLWSSFFISTAVFSQDEVVLSEEGRNAEFQERWREVYDQIFQDEILAQWAMDRFIGDIKDDYDALIDELVFEHPFVARLWPDILRQAELVAQVYVIQHLMNGSESLDALDGELQNHPEGKQLLRPVLEGLPLSRSARESARIFHIPQSTMNAYTWSGLRYTSIQMAFFDGLLTQLSDEQIQAVQAHEVAHIMSLHIPVSMFLTAIFFATGDILLPASEKHLLEHHLDKFAAGLISNARGELHERASESIPPAIKSLAARIREEAERHPEEMMAFMADLANRMEFSNSGREGLEAAWSTSVEAAGFDIKAYMEFQEKMAKRSRSCEVTCDRLAAIVAGPDAAEGAFLILQAGPGANPLAVRKGSDEVLRALAENPELRQIINDDGRSHPNLSARRRAIREFAKTDTYRIHRDPFLVALVDYIAVSKLLIEYDYTNHEQLGELADRARSDFVKEQYIGMARALRDLLIEGVLEEFRADQSSLQRFAAIYHAISLHLEEYAAEDEVENIVNQKFVEELRKNERLLPMLIQALSGLPESERREGALELLEDLMPSDLFETGIESFISQFGQGPQGANRSQQMGDLKNCGQAMLRAGKPGRLVVSAR